MPSRSIIRTGVGPHREPGNRFPAMAAINLLAARAARVQARRNLSRSLSPKLDHSHSITRFDRSRTGPYDPARLHLLHGWFNESEVRAHQRLLKSSAGHNFASASRVSIFSRIGSEMRPTVPSRLAGHLWSILKDGSPPQKIQRVPSQHGDE